MKRVFLAFLVISGLTGGYFGWKFFYALHAFTSQNLTAQAQILRWEVEEVGSRYGIRAVYEYETASGTSLLSSLYLNEFSALDEVKKLAQQQHTVYHDGRGHSSFSREFPMNFGWRFVLSALIFIYFATRFRSSSNSRSSGPTTNRFQKPPLA